MPKLIKNGSIVDDATAILGATDNIIEGPVLVPLQRWLKERDQLCRNSQLGVWMNGDEEPELLAEDAPRLPLIGIRFPTFNDGRGLSLAVLLRTRYGFKGDLRAIGDVQQDQLNYMLRCGFTSFAVREDRDIEAALKGLKVMREHYQSSVIDPQPLFRQRG